MWVGPLWMPSVSGHLAHEYKTNVASDNMRDAKAIHENGVKRINSLKQAGDVVPHSAAEFFTRQGRMTSVSQKVGDILHIEV